MRVVEGQMVKIETVGALKQFSFDNDKKWKESYQRSLVYSNSSEYGGDRPHTSHQSTMEYINNKGEKVRRRTRQVALVGEKVRIIELSNGWVIDFDPYSKKAILDYVLSGIVIYLLLK